MLILEIIEFKRDGFVSEHSPDVKVFKIFSTFRRPSESDKRSFGVPLNKDILDKDLSKSGMFLRKV